MKLNFLDYRALYIEQLFAEMSFVTSRENSFSPAETVDYISKLIFFKRFSLCRKILRTIKYLSSLPTTTDYLPADVSELTKHKFFIFDTNYDYLLPFFSWLKELYKSNADRRNRWTIALNDCGNHSDDNTKDFLVNFSKLSGQRAAISEAENEIVFFTAIRHWGTVELHLEKGYFLTDRIPSIVGNVGCIEAEYRYDSLAQKDIFELTFLVDKFFNETDLCQRAFSDDGWELIKISCDNISLQAKFCDYTEKFLSFGQSYRSVLYECINGLADKEAITGQRMLNPEERRLVPISKFLFALGITNENNTIFSDKINERILYDLLENHVSFNFVKDFFGEIKTDCASSVYNALKTIDEQYDPEYPSDIFPLFRSLRKYMISSIRFGFFEPTAKLITDSFKKATCDYEYKYAAYNGFCLSQEVISLVIKEYLDGYGYEGEFPHYRKKSKKYERYISVICNGSYFSDDNSLLRLDFSVAAAYQKRTSDEKLSKKNDEYIIPFEEINAADIRSSLHVQGAKIGTDCDFGAASLIYPYENSEKLNDYINDFAVKFNMLCNTAFNFAEGKPLPSKYRTLRFLVSLKNKHLLNLIAKTVPLFTVSASMCIIFLVNYLSLDNLIQVSLGAGALVWLLVAIILWVKDICSADDYN